MKNFQIHTIKNEHRVNSTAKRLNLLYFVLESLGSMSLGECLKYVLGRNCKKNRKNKSNGKMVRLHFCRRFIIFLIVFCKYIKMKQRLVNSTPQFLLLNHQRWSRGHKKIRGQGHTFRGQTLSMPNDKDITQKSSRKKRSWLKKSQIFRKIQAISVKKKKKIFARKFASSLACSSNAHNLGKFSACQKIVLFLSRRQGIFDDLQASRSRSRTSKCILEDSTSGNHRASYHMVHIRRNVRVTYANKTLLLNIKFYMINRVYRKNPTCFDFAITWQNGVFG